MFRSLEREREKQQYFLNEIQSFETSTNTILFFTYCLLSSFIKKPIEKSSSSSSSKVQKADPVVVEPKVSNTPIVAAKEETKEPQKEPEVKSRVVEAPADDEWNEVKVVSKQDKRDQIYKQAPKPKVTQPAS